MTRARRIMAAAAGVALAGLMFLHTGTAQGAPATALRPATCSGDCYQIQSTGPGGCWKDQGLDAQYTVSTCATASEFNINRGTVYMGIQYYELLDGSGNCATLDAGDGYAVKAETCNGDEPAQLWTNVALTAPNYQTSTLWDAQHDASDGYVATKGSTSPYYLLETTGDGSNTLWKTTCQSGPC